LTVCFKSGQSGETLRNVCVLETSALAANDSVADRS
jgi:hypothetical protein